MNQEVKIAYPVEAFPSLEPDNPGWLVIDARGFNVCELPECFEQRAKFIADAINVALLASGNPKQAKDSTDSTSNTEDK